MTRLIIAVMLAGLGFGPALARDYIWINYEDTRESIRIKDLRSLSVCDFKREMASRFGLDMRWFDVKRGSVTLKDSGSLKDAGINSNSDIIVAPRSSVTSQCR